MIHATALTDDHIIQTNFDATLWFEQASDADILDLARCGWGGDYPADAVAQHFAKTDDGLKGLFAYLEAIRDLPLKRDCCGFDCHVDEDEALAWLRQNRPHLLADIELEKEPAWTQRVEKHFSPKEELDELRTVLARLLAAPDLNLDRLESETVTAIADARAVLRSGFAERGGRTGSTDQSEPQDLRVENALLRGSLFLTARSLKDYHDVRHTNAETEGMLQLTVPERLREKAGDAITRADKLLQDPGRGR